MEIGQSVRAVVIAENVINKDGDFVMLTMDGLKKAIRTIMSYDVNLEYLYECFDDVEGMSNDESLNWAVEQLCSDELLDVLNHDMRLVPVVSMAFLDYDTAEDVLKYEQTIRPGVVSMPKIWPKPIVRVGCDYVNEGGCSDNDFFTAKNCCCYIDEDGEVIFVRSYFNSFQLDAYDEEEQPCVRYLELIDKDDEDVCPLLNDVDYLMPDVFEGFWDV